MSSRGMDILQSVMTSYAVIRRTSKHIHSSGRIKETEKGKWECKHGAMNSKNYLSALVGTQKF